MELIDAAIDEIDESKRVEPTWDGIDWRGGATTL
jgi:hypothetical protein